MLLIQEGAAEFVREPLLGEFGFKGGHVGELWQTAVQLRGTRAAAVGLGVQSVLWSDAAVAAQNCPSGGNALMFAVTNAALRLCGGVSFDTPEELLTGLLPAVFQYGRDVTGLPELRRTFVLNALVPLDSAAWVLMAREKGLPDFDALIPADVRPALGFRQEKLGRIPLIPYGMSRAGITAELDGGAFFLKIKIGSDPCGDRDPEKMLAWDKARLTEIHRLAQERETPYTDSGHILYYLDANGRYPSRDALERLLEHADQIGALDRIALLEEPFDEKNELPVHGLPVRIAADESAHCEEDVRRRIQMGYSAIALKPIAKTLSMSFGILRAAHQAGVPCFCADLTVNPAMVEWNKNVAARLAPLPGLRIGVVETNGHQNYRRWEQMERWAPRAGSAFTKPVQGVYTLDEAFYRSSGGILEDSPYYSGLFGGASGREEPI